MTRYPAMPQDDWGLPDILQSSYMPDVLFPMQPTQDIAEESTPIDRTAHDRHPAERFTFPTDQLARGKRGRR